MVGGAKFTRENVLRHGKKGFKEMLYEGKKRKKKKCCISDFLCIISDSQMQLIKKASVSTHFSNKFFVMKSCVTLSSDLHMIFNSTIS